MYSYADRERDSFLSLGDLIFFLCVVFFAFLAVHGSTLISGNGAIIDSDLATYAQGMAGAEHAGLFVQDPVLNLTTQANSIWNLERFVAQICAPHEQYAIGLIRAGAIGIVLFYLSFYIFGRWLLHNRPYAVLLTLLVSITVWVGCGTFWGIVHSDPVPRVWHAAFFPWML
ncbi:MAG: translation initiation factor 2, partial [Desulfovibrio sp.]|nr:translation initiation factor 2 [Desulfovibrio sp.]